MTTAQQTRNAGESFARGLFTRGSDFLAASEVNQVLDISLDNVPPIPFTEERLTKARKFGLVLTLFVPANADGEPLTMQGVMDILGNELEDDGKLLYDTSWYKAGVLFTTDPIVTKPTWMLIGRDVIPNSTNLNYLEQTQALADYLVDVFYEDEEVPALYREAVDEFTGQKDELAALMNSDWKAAAQRLSALKLNQLFRPTPGQLTYLIALYQGVNKERLFENVYHWSPSRSSSGSLVAVGYADRRGAGVHVSGPGSSISYVGVVFSCSGLPED